jgi:hypothetical protein
MRIFSALFALLLLISMTSCESEMTLQRYFYEAQENNEFMIIELPASILGSSLNELTEKQRETVASVRKVSALIYRDSTKSDFLKEQRRIINEFLNRDGFEPLFAARMNDEAQVSIQVQGAIDQIDEAVFFGYADDQGFILARVLGDKMNPAAFMELATTLEESEFEALTQGLLKDVLGEEEL